MDKKKILIVARTFFPEQSPRSFRTTELAKELARQGHQVDVLLPKNMQEKIENEFDNSLGIKFLYFGLLTWKPFERSKISWIGDWKRKFGRLLFLLFEYPNIEIYYKLPKILKTLKGYDLMVSIAVPHENHWAIAKVRTAKHPIAKIWVADCGDPFMTNVLETIAPPFYFRALENSFLKKADFISVPTATSADAYSNKYHDKFQVIPQGFNFEEVDIAAIKPTHKAPTFAYAGGVSATGIRSLHEVIKVLKEIGKPFTFHVFGANAKAVLQAVAIGYEEQIVLHDAIPRRNLLYKLSEMDFLINLDNGTHLNTPSKLIDYALSQRPILSIDPLHPNRSRVTSFLKGDYRDATIINDIQVYNIKNVASNFLNLLSSDV
ncbi:glycosyltransferase involved in cell wall biosynthesis [Flavobacterium sp. PL11]|uniref:glycosyltransferase n=1 Tax=Flavobacterium sp. PL11 TaxID=3071717 RepID=UPI002DF81362|nr:glycosyltransferase involved in cell wall biosynthesis [Flavobacterium sp. PL11]